MQHDSFIARISPLLIPFCAFFTQNAKMSTQCGICVCHFYALSLKLLRYLFFIPVIQIWSCILYEAQLDIMTM
jgi:hypothetical protein